MVNIKGNSIKSDEELKQDIQEKIRVAWEEYKSRTERYFKILELLGEKVSYPKDEKQIKLPIENKSTNGYVPKTLNAKVKLILEEYDKPLTTKKLMEEINSRFLDKKYIFDFFSGTFSQMYRRKKSGIRKYDIPNAGLKNRSVYGFEEWFENETELKQEYKEKIGELI